MLIGYNNDVQYRGKTFHIQTEDHGLPDARIETQLFHSGAILDTKLTSYERVLKEGLNTDEQKRRIKSIMQASHKGLYKKLLAGEYNTMVGLDPVEEVGDVDEAAEQFTPGQERVPEAALLVEEGKLDSLGGETGDQLDVSKLKSKLASLSEGSSPRGSGVYRSGAHASAKRTLQNAPSIPVPTAEKIEAQSLSFESDDEFGDFLEMEGQFEAGSNMPLPVIEFSSTGARAWRGCHSPTDDLSIVHVVERYLAGA